LVYVCASGQLHIGYAALATAMPTGKAITPKFIFALFYKHFMCSEFFWTATRADQIAAF